MFNIKYVILSVDFIYIYIAIYRYIYVHIEVKKNIQHFLRISYVMSKKYNRNIYIYTHYIHCIFHSFKWNNIYSMEY